MTSETNSDTRRTADVRLAEKIDALADMLSGHIAGDGRCTTEIQAMVKQYFDEMDARSHIHHHRHIDEEIKIQTKTEEMWDSIRKNLLEKVILLVVGAAISYFATIVYADVTVRLKNPTPHMDHRPLTNEKPTATPKPETAIHP